MPSSTLTRLSDTFVISCGTITLDPVRAKMLLIRWKKNGEVFLPKGRKNINETLEDTAIRETYEETGARVSLLPLRIQTLATPGAAVNPACELITEPVAFSQRLTDGGILKLIFWFAAEGDSTAAHDVGTQQEGEDFDPVWLDLENAVQALTFDDDKKIAEKVIVAFKASSMPSSSRVPKIPK